MNNINMLNFDRSFSEGIDVKKTSKSKEYGICHYWYFADKGFMFQPNVCHRSHNLLISYEPKW